MLDPIPHTKHQPIDLKMNVIPHHATPIRQHFNLKKADWKSFADDLDLPLTDLPAIPNNYDAFVKLFRASSRKNIPQGYCTNEIQSLSDDAKELYQEYTKLFEDNCFGTDTLECGDTLTNSYHGGQAGEVAGVD